MLLTCEIKVLYVSCFQRYYLQKSPLSILRWTLQNGKHFKKQKQQQQTLCDTIYGLLSVYSLGFVWDCNRENYNGFKLTFWVGTYRERKTPPKPKAGIKTHAFRLTHMITSDSVLLARRTRVLRLSKEYLSRATLVKVNAINYHSMLHPIKRL